MREGILPAVCLLTLPVVLGLAVLLALLSGSGPGANEGSMTCYTAPGTWVGKVYIPGPTTCTR